MELGIKIKNKMKIQILDNPKKKNFIEGVSYLGITAKDVPYLLLKTGKERVNAFSGSLSNEELMALWRILPIEGAGLYFGKQIVDKRTGRKESRLSLDALHFLKGKINKNIIKLSKEQERQWFLGQNIEVEEEQTAEVEGDFVAVVSDNKEDFIGTGKLTLDKKTLLCFLPKERRVRS